MLCELSCGLETYKSENILLILNGFNLCLKLIKIEKGFRLFNKRK
jgi:hypothetical protein